MPSEQDMLIEAYGRGLLPQEKATLLEEAHSRGLINLPTKSSYKLSQEMTHTPQKEVTVDSALVENLPQTTGGIVGGVAGALSPVPGGALLGAGIGGAGAKAWQDVYNHFVTPEEAPKTSLEALKRIGKAGGEEILWEAGGQIVGKVVGKGYHVLRPKVDAGISGLQEMMERYGGSFTKAERTSNWLTQQTDSLVRGSLTGKGVMKAADDINEAALKAWQDDLSQQIASGAKSRMSNEEFGELVQNTITGGRASFKSHIGELYNNFDELVKTSIEKSLVKKEVTSSILDESGKPISRTVLEEVVKETRPVDVRPLKNEAAKLLQRLSESGNLGKSEFGGETINKILSLDDAMKFSSAQNARSHLLDLQRTAELAGDSKLAGSLKNFSSKISVAMDKAAATQGADTLKAYQLIKREAKEGYETFNNKLISKMVHEDSFAGDLAGKLFRDGNVAQIHQMKAAIVKAAKYDKTIQPKQVLNQIKQKYLESVLSKTTRSIEMEAGESLATHQA